MGLKPRSRWTLSAIAFMGAWILIGNGLSESWQSQVSACQNRFLNSGLGRERIEEKRYEGLNFNDSLRSAGFDFRRTCLDEIGLDLNGSPNAIWLKVMVAPVDGVGWVYRSVRY